MARLFMIGMGLLILVSCTTTKMVQCPACPAADSVIMTNDGFVLIPQGHLDDAENFKTLKELERMHDEFLEKYDKRGVWQ